ncbi:phytoene synthase [Streptacidiphilus sp. MAP12-20]|uniref:phytoene/squalene synthase family protein n=1 Tax=Streptacidiphilus sp. MAP12-20 TaxID=3156299 RepID=UPI0035131633
MTLWKPWKPSKPWNSWDRALDAARVTDPALRADYTAQRRAVARFKREAYLAVRLLVPPELVPHVLVATAFMHHTDNLLDSGPLAGRREAYRVWEHAVRAALAGSARADSPLVRALAHSADAHPALREHAEAFLDTALADLDFVGFRTEADYQAYLDAYSLPALMVVACLLAPPTAEVRAACRAYIDGSQRLDFVTDLAEDLAADRLTVPLDTLKEFGVTREDLATAQDTPATRALLAHLLTLARTSLDRGRTLLALTPPANRPMVRTLIALDDLTAAAATAKGAALLRAPFGPPLPAALALLLREYRAARAVGRRGRRGVSSG